MSRVTYWLEGYNRETERLVEHHLVPDALLLQARLIANAGADEFGIVMLSDDAAHALAALIGVTIDTARCEYFFEATADDTAA